jgi:hypothetical protein
LSGFFLELFEYSNESCPKEGFSALKMMNQRELKIALSININASLTGKSL